MVAAAQEMVANTKKTDFTKINQAMKDLNFSNWVLLLAIKLFTGNKDLPSAILAIDSGLRKSWLDLMIDGVIPEDIGPIPPELGNMYKLSYLQLNNNQLVGKIPPELASVPSGGGGAAAVAVAATAGGGGATAPAAAEAAKKVEKVEEKEESDDDLGFSLFD